jgi:hypothetical protein
LFRSKEVSNGYKKDVQSGDVFMGPRR